MSKTVFYKCCCVAATRVHWTDAFEVQSKCSGVELLLLLLLLLLGCRDCTWYAIRLQVAAVNQTKVPRSTEKPPMNGPITHLPKRNEMHRCCARQFHGSSSNTAHTKAPCHEERISKRDCCCCCMRGGRGCDVARRPTTLKMRGGQATRRGASCYTYPSR